MSASSQHEPSPGLVDTVELDSHAPGRFLLSPLIAIGRWTGGSWIRRMIGAGVVLLLVAGTVGTWLYLAQLAIHAEQSSLTTALELLENRRYEEARTLASQMLNGSARRSEVGGPLFVLGAVKSNEAISQATTIKRRIDYLVASRYLKEARHFGFPPGRKDEGLMLLGTSLIESEQFPEGIAVLEELLASAISLDTPRRRKAHRLLAETCLFMPAPDLNKASRHLGALLSDAELPDDLRSAMLLLAATVESRLGDFDEARRQLDQIPQETVEESRLTLARAEIALDELEAAQRRVDGKSIEASIASQRSKIEEFMQSLEQIRSSTDSSDQKRLATYLQGRGFAILGRNAAALQQFSRTRQLYNDSPEAIAAALFEAELLRKQADDSEALVAYRRVLEDIPDPDSYRSTILSLAQIRAHLLGAIGDFVERQKFNEAMTLIENLTPSFPHADQLALRAQTLERWGNQQLTHGDDQSNNSEAIRTAGLRHLREAGLAYEQLAEQRFATTNYTDDLWKSANAYFRGHAYSDAIRVFNEYLDNELELRNAEALLRLGQANLALGRDDLSIAALEECIEFHPFDPSSYQARIDCAKAYWNQGRLEDAERLLRDNISGTLLNPSSREWRDSLFILGTLLHEQSDYAEAIDVLEEAIQRYPDDSQRLIAQYVIGESYRRWAEEPLADHQQARTDNERDKSVQLAQQRLTAALRSFTEIQRHITLRAQDIHQDPLIGAMLRNCYMFEATVLFDLNRYEDAIKAYSNVSALYPNEPFVLETFVQIANCWRRLNRDDKARGAIEQARIALERFPNDADFASATSFSREEWRQLLNDMSRW